MPDSPPPPTRLTWLCRCEEVSIEEVHGAVAAGARTLNDVKRRTRLGMGACQGIYCLPHAARLLLSPADAGATPPAPMTVRPPLRPIALERMATPKE